MFLLLVLINKKGQAQFLPASTKTPHICKLKSQLHSWRGDLGVWRSWLAHLHGMQGVRGSNPRISTKNKAQQNFGRNSVGY